MIPATVPPAATRVFCALAYVHARDGRATIRDVMDAAGLTSTSTCWRHLQTLRDEGLVTWDETRRGTLRPTVRAMVPA